MGPNFAGGRLAPGLKIASHNIAGIRDTTRYRSYTKFPGLSKLYSLFRIWRTLDPDILCLQETHLHTSDEATLRQTEQRLYTAPEDGFRRYTPIWGNNDEASSAGVALLVRSSLIESGALKLHGHTHVDPDGRLMHTRIEWGGHRFRLINVYLPSSNPTEQANFLSSRLSPLLSSLGDTEQSIIIGDFNFTDNPAADRATPPNPASSSSYHRDNHPATIMKQLQTTFHFADTYRSIRPVGRPQPNTFTYLAGAAAIPTSRLDRAYATLNLMTHIHSSTISLDPGPSDHRPIVLNLHPIRRPSNLPSPPARNARARMTFSSDPVLKAAFTSWLETQVQHAPTDHTALIQWWPLFKRTVAQKMKSLNLDLKAQRLNPSTCLKDATQALATAVDAHAASTSPAMHLPAVLRAQQTLRAALVHSAIPPEKAARFRWLREGERPSPLMTKLISPPEGSNYIGTIRCTGSGFLSSGQGMADYMANYFASVSQAPPRDQQAEDVVIQAVRKHAKTFSPQQATVVGHREVTQQEVATAIKNSQPGRAPGPDGLPIELWRKFTPVIAPLLASVFSAIGTLGRVPNAFLAGELNPFHKGGDPTDPAAYRPITLLNTDYRILAKVLANRLSPEMAATIGPEQTAFLPGRLIGDNIIFMQLLPSLLRSNGSLADLNLASKAVVAFLDFRKAYDTVLRPFLYKVLEAKGVGKDFTHWVMLLLSETCTSARVNGYISKPVEYEAGLRQGCPLAPILYLFVAEALMCWLKECPSVGVTITPNNIVHGLQFADDSWPLLRDLASQTIGRFLDTMVTFSHATNQHINRDKTHFLPVGDITTWGSLPETVHGIKVVPMTKALGVHYTNDPSTCPPPAVPWNKLRSLVHARLTKIAKLPISMWGRATAAHSYALSQLLFQAEFCDIPKDLVQDIQKWTTMLIDRQAPPPPLPNPSSPPPLPPPTPPPTPTAEPSTTATPLMRPPTQPPRNTPKRLRPPGVPSTLLIGTPRQGGFGAIPWREHITARHAVWGSRCLRWLAPGESPPKDRRGVTLTQPLWIPMASSLLTRMRPNAHPALTMLRTVHNRCIELPITLRTGPLARMTAGLAALGPIEIINKANFQPGPHIVNDMPLWDNPLLSIGSPPPPHPLASLASTPGLRTIGDLSRIRATLPSQPPPHRTQIQHAIEFLWRAVPQQWRQLLPSPSPLSSLQPQESSGQGVTKVIQHLGWKTGAPDGDPAPHLSPMQLTVRQATSAQLKGTTIAGRIRALSRFIVSTGNPPSPTNMRCLRVNLAKLWDMPWEPYNKETLWRLINNGVSGAGGHDTINPHPCPCGWAPPSTTTGDPSSTITHCDAWRAHAFWTCPVAQAVVGEIMEATSLPINMQNIWLLHPPTMSPYPIDPGLWLPVAAAALSAMHHGRKVMYATNKISVTPPPQTPSTDRRASQVAISKFWTLLQDFADCAQPAASDTPRGHPFFQVRHGCVSLQPPPIRLPADLD